MYKIADQGQKVNHAGFDRDILTRNPRRYNEYGDELEDSESDAEADADAEEENPYGEIKLEGTLICCLAPTLQAICKGNNC